MIIMGWMMGLCFLREMQKKNLINCLGFCSMAGISIPLAKRAADTLKLCKFCLQHYLDPKNENALLSNSKLNFTFDVGESGFCMSCFGLLSSDSIDNIATIIHSFVIERGLTNCDFSISINATPILDMSRILIRTVLTGSSEKTFSFPAINDLISRLVVTVLGNSRLSITSESDSTCKVTVTISVSHQLLYCRGLWPEFRETTTKRKRNVVEDSLHPTSTTEFSLSRSQSDGILAELKKMPKAKLDELEQRIISFQESEDAKQIEVSWSLSSERSPVYLFGRYKKLSRDVPQSLWMITAASSEQKEDEEEGKAISDHSVDNNQLAQCSKPTHQRKGRNSVEEIVSFAVKKVSGCSECHLHACGREDIDVRCLGNGRPFALEILNPSLSLGVEEIKSIEDSINSNVDLNSEGDVQVSHLSKTDRNCWEFMQKKAEEKKKGYCCVVWSERPVDRVALLAIEKMASDGRDRDEAGIPCLQIHQRTPLRVLHRRSLIDRVRYVYNIETALINSHFFLLRLVTSAGTYVKEFVHGDLGRTIPSIYSVLNCHTDILQLDVTKLFDDFIGGSNFVSNTSTSSIVESDATATTHLNSSGSAALSWESLSCMKLPSSSSTSRHSTDSTIQHLQS